MGFWDTIVIGSGKVYNQARGIEIDGEITNISENESSYWISDCYLGAGVTVFKDTKEGKEITKLIKLRDRGMIKHYLDCLVLKHCSTEKLKELIESAVEKSFIEGKEEIRREMLGLLGLAR